ncbi:MAG: mechanosensitive ion channel family protein [Gammaproteobacteria bacterium]|nr:mechanosensitive ion channel family protein [Gammaproteobacteria bacterium]NNF66189.1 mechanosensitive ion channel family protein [Gammaproteobacteria bacterium]
MGELTSIAKASVALLPNLAVAVLLLIATWLLTKLARRIIAGVSPSSASRRSLVIATQKIIVALIWISGIMLTAVVLFPGVTPGSLLAGLGIGSVAIGFAFKDIFENFLAGMLILTRQPFRIDDYVEVNGIEGKVESITVRDTIVRQTDGQPVVVPNAILFKNPVTVRTDKDRRRASVVCGVGYGEDVGKARDVIAKAVKGVESVDDADYPVQVLAASFGASSVDFEIRWWTGSQPGEVKKSTDAVIEAVKKALDDAGIEIPFPYRTLTFSEKLRIESN